MDFTFDESEPATATPPKDREIVPPGVHDMEIKQAEDGKSPYRTSDANPEGHCLMLRLAKGKCSFVFDDISKTNGARARDLATAIGVKPGKTKVSLAPADLVGCVVGVEIEHYVGKKSGKTTAIVKRYLPKVAKPDPGETNDDIPF